RLTCFFFSSRRRHTRSKRDWSSDVCSSDLSAVALVVLVAGCAVPNAGLYESDTGAAGRAPASELSGAWHGTFGWVGAYHYEDEEIGRASCRERVGVRVGRGPARKKKKPDGA